jgi:hypothetical protein
LPPGSTEKSRTVSETKVTNNKAGFGKPQDGSLMIYFDSTTNWEGVTAHIGAELNEQGFTELANPLKDIGSAAAGTLGNAAAGKFGAGMAQGAASGLLDYTRTYSKEGYSVTLTNMQSIVESKILSKFRKGGDKAPGQYMLMITRSAGTNFSEPGKVELPAAK